MSIFRFAACNDNREIDGDAIAPLCAQLTLPRRSAVASLWRDVRKSDTKRAGFAFDRVAQSCRARDGDDHAHGDLLAIHATALALADDCAGAVAVARQGLRHGASGACARMAELVLCFCAWRAGGEPDLINDFLARVRVADGPGNADNRDCGPVDVIAAVLELALAAAIAFGRLCPDDAERLARNALVRATGVAGLSAYPVCILARVVYEQGRLDEAERLLKPHLSAIREVVCLDSVSHGYVVLSRIAARRGDRVGAVALLDEATALARERGWNLLLATMLAERVRLCGPDDERAAAVAMAGLRNLAERHEPVVAGVRSDIAGSLACAELHWYLTFGKGSPKAALDCLRQEARLSGEPCGSAVVTLAEAQVMWLEGDRAASMDRLTIAMQMAQRTGLRQLLVDAGAPMAAMLACFVKRRGVDPGLSHFATGVNACLQRPACAAPSRNRARRGRETLTARERDVLRLISEGGTNKLIARAQGVAPETIKTHVKNIFVKLGVERRAQAVAMAQRLGLLALPAR